MGRPIKKSYFANLNAPYNNFATGGATGIGGEGVATVAIATTGTLYRSTATVAFGLPQLPGGVRATASITVSTVTGGVTLITLTNAGSGYTATPTATVTPATTGTTATFTVTLLTTNQAGIAASAFIPGGTQASLADIMEQRGSRRYMVKTADGQGVCKLVAKASPAEGEMSITATDSDNGTYYVIKLTSRKALLVPITGTQFAENTNAGWNMNAAVAGVSVKVSNN